MDLARRAMLAGAAGLFCGREAKARVLSRTLDGYWSGASFTEFERPKELPRLVLTPEEAEAWEAPRRAQGGMAPAKPGEVGQAESEFNERGAGLMRIDGQIRSSLLVDPPDGRVPYRPEVAASLGLAADAPRTAKDAGPEERPLSERCLSSGLSGAPMIPGPDANVLQFVQTPDSLAIVCEKYHEVRVIPLSGAPLPARLTPSWIGTSAGRWEGDVLVVETAGFRPGLTDRSRGLAVSGATRVLERFSRVSPTAIRYEAEVSDPEILTRPWRAEMMLVPAGRIFEYACHEGNYGLPDILRIFRQADAAPAQRAQP